MKYLLLICLFSFTLQAQTIRYIKPISTGTGDGSSWANASSNLQAILDETGVDQVWVAAGTYKPMTTPSGCTNCSGTKDYAFRIPSGIELYGGFTGTETQITQRNPGLSATILDGDIGTAGVSSDNTNHVVVAVNLGPEGISIDGVTIKNGRSTSFGQISIDGVSISKSDGAGLFITGGTNMINQVRFENNQAYSSGGGTAIYNSENTISNSTFDNNKSDFAGGGLYDGGTKLTLSSCSFSNNFCDFNGGGGSIGSDLYTIVLCNFTNNRSSFYGGGLDFVGSAGTTEKCHFKKNTSEYGGGAFRATAGSYTFKQNSFQENTSAGTFGGFGGVGAVDCFDFNFENNLLIQNSSPSTGGLYLTSYGNPFRIVNNTFFENESGTEGAAISFAELSPSDIVANNLFWGNTLSSNASSPGADIYCRSDSGTATFLNNSLQLPVASYDVSDNGHYAIGSTASGNLFATNPLFVNSSDPDGADNLLKTTDDGLGIQSSSPMTNAGNSTYGPPDDFTGQNRQGLPDIGAYEFITITCPETFVVSGSVSTNQKANLSMTTTGNNLIKQNTNVTYQAGKYIQLNPGFSTGINAVFMTRLLSGCQ